MFELEFDGLYHRQLAEARGQRREMLGRDLTGTKKMLEVIYPVIESLDGIELEYEMVSLSGVKFYCDAFIHNWKIVLEEESYLTHAEMVTRKRFSFERARARSVAVLGYAYFPYGRDELEQQPDACRRDFSELKVALGVNNGSSFAKLPALEREILRFAMMQLEPFDLSAISSWLQYKRETCSRFVKDLVAKGLLMKIGGGEKRSHKFMLSERAKAMLLKGSARDV